jgi:hypothetical protein
VLAAEEPAIRCQIKLRRIPDKKEETMRSAGLMGAIGLCLILAAPLGLSSGTAQEGLSGYQGAWLAGGDDCAEVYSFSGKGASFKEPVDIFAPAFIVSGKRLRTPQAQCMIKSVQPSGNRQVFVLNCTNSVAGHEVRALMSTEPDGILKRYFNAQDVAGTPYRRCSR